MEMRSFHSLFSGGGLTRINPSPFCGGWAYESSGPHAEAKTVNNKTHQPFFSAMAGGPHRLLPGVKEESSLDDDDGRNNGDNKLG